MSAQERRLADGLATALLGGDWTQPQMARRASAALGTRQVPRWVSALAEEAVLGYRDPPVDRPRELARFLLGTPAWDRDDALRARRGPRQRRALHSVDADGRLGPARIRRHEPLPTAIARSPWPLTPLPDLAALAALLDVAQGELAWFADIRGWERNCAPALRHYTWTSLPRPRGGARLIAAPKPRLKEIQRRILRHVLAPIPVHDCAHGSIAGRSVRTATTPHGGSTVVIRMDLTTFFASVAAGRVYGMLRVAGLPEPVAHCVTGLLTTVVPRGMSREPALAAPHLPQGAPTSPRAANLVAFALDRRLAGLAERYDARYTRYVDDLIFSGGRSLRTGRSGFVRQVSGIVRSEGFAVNDAKTVVLGDAGRQAVLGAVLNVHPAVPRAERDVVRAIVHNCVRHGWQSQSAGRSADQFRAELLGRIAWIGSVHPAHGARLRTSADRIDWA